MAKKAKEAIKEILQNQGLVVEKPVRNWISTGCTILDLALANQWPGGIPGGRFVQIFGASSTCKTVLGMTTLGAAQRQGGLAFFADVEHTFDAHWATLYGLDVTKDSFQLGYPISKDEWKQPRTVEDFWDIYIPWIINAKSDGSKVVVVDSLAALTDAKELETNIGDSASYAAKAKQMSKGFRKYISEVANEDVTVIFLDQTRANISGYGEKEITAGGEAIPFYMSTRIHLKPAGRVLDSKGNVIGIEVYFLVKKNKAGIPYREGNFRILFNYGLDDIWSNLNFIKRYKDGASSKTVTFAGETKQMSYMIAHVEKNNLEKQLQEETVAVWNEQFTIKKRKERVW